MFKMQPEETRRININQFYSLLCKEALQTLRRISAGTKRAPKDELIKFRQKYVRPQSQAAAKPDWHKLTFHLNTKSLSDFLEDLNECPKRAFAPVPQQMTGK